VSLSKHPRNLAVWLLIAAALLLRASVPVGWMPVAADDGLRIMLCGGTGPVELSTQSSAADHQDHQEHRGHGDRDPCPFALALGKSLDVPSQVETFLLPDAMTATADAWAPIARPVVWRGLRPPARGPPLPA